MKISINKNWQFVEGFEPSYLLNFPSSHVVDIPHCPIELDEVASTNHHYKGTWSYFKSFDFEVAPNERAFLTIEGAMLKVQVYLNGIDLNTQVSGYHAVRFELTEHLKPKANKLLIVLTHDDDPTYSPFNSDHDYYCPPGIYRNVYLEKRTKTFIDDLFVRGHSNGDLAIKYTLNGDSKLLEKPLFSLYRRGRKIAEFKEENKHIQGIIGYSNETPELYELEMKIVTSEGEDIKKVTFGFKDAKWNKEGFFINGKKLFLVGLNRHALYPYQGLAMPESSQYDDAFILRKKLGLNVVRTSHYHQGEDFLNACDELGLFVISEIPGWNFLSNDKAWRENYLKMLEKMIKEERNHPCIIAYGIRIDESADDDDLYTKGQKLAHELDGDIATIGVRNFTTSKCIEDIYGFNDFSCWSLTQKRGCLKRKEVKGAKNKPLLITEHNGHMFPTSVHAEPTRKAEQALRHLKVLDSAMGTPGIAGCLGWCAFDYPSNEGYGDSNNYCHHGVFDQFRNPKEAAFAYAAEMADYPVLRVVADFYRHAHDAAMYRPFIAFSNCDYIEQYKDGKLVHVYSPDHKHYPNLKHPPFIMDHFVEADFVPKGYSYKEAKALRAFISLKAQKGTLKFKDFMAHPLLVLKKRLTNKKLDEYALKTVNNYHEPTWLFRGIKNGSPIIEKTFGPLLSKQLFIDMTSDVLSDEESYDTLRVTVRAVDSFGTTIKENSTLNIEIQGPIRVIGPTSIAFHNGVASFYVRGKFVSRPCVAILKIHAVFASKEEIIKVY